MRASIMNESLPISIRDNRNHHKVGISKTTFNEILNKIQIIIKTMIGNRHCLRLRYFFKEYLIDHKFQTDTLNLFSNPKRIPHFQYLIHAFVMLRNGTFF